MKLLRVSALAIPVLAVAFGACSKKQLPGKAATPTLMGAAGTATPGGTPQAGAAATQEKYLIVIVEAEPEEGKAPLTVHFKSGREPGSGKPPLQFLWNFGDGTESTEENPVHTFTQPGSYEVTLKASDATGDTDEDFVRIEVYGPED